jgi:hypothetical protein
MSVQKCFCLSGKMAILAALACLALPPEALRGQQSSEAAPASAQSVNPEEVVLTVGETKITAAEFEQIVSALPPQFRAMMATLGKKGFAEQFGNLLGLALEGEKRQLDQTEEFRRMMEFDRKVLLAQVTMNNVATTVGPASPEEVGYYYESHQQEFEQVRVTGILVSFAPPRSTAGAASLPRPQLTEQQAQRKALELRARINAGVDMAGLAKTESSHPTASKGGDFGFLGRGQTTLPAEMTNAIFALQANRVSAPIRDRLGFFLFRAEDKRVQPLEEVQQGIRASLSMEKLNSHLERLRAAYPVTLNSTYFPATQPAAPAAQGAPQR